MTYKFYEKEALKKVPLAELDKRFGISASDYDQLIMEKGFDDTLLFHLLTKMNRFDVIDNRDENYDYGCKLYENTPASVLNALYYDREYYPDEVVFVTTNKKTAEIANKYFGDDSIKIIK